MILEEAIVKYKTLAEQKDKLVEMDTLGMFPNAKEESDEYWALVDYLVQLKQIKKIIDTRSYTDEIDNAQYYTSEDKIIKIKEILK